jgi:DNA repair protein RadD
VAEITVAFELRQEQGAALTALYSAWGRGESNLLVVMATGTGKGPTIAALTKDIVTRWPDERILITSDSQEIVRQDYDYILQQWPGAPIGMNAVALGRRDWDQQVIVAQVQSIHRSAHKLGTRRIVIVDEAHKIPRYRDAMFQKVFAAVGAKEITGFTATDFRLDSGRLTEGKGSLFSTVVFEFGYREALEARRVVTVYSKNPKAQIDTSGVGIKRGDFAASELEAIANEAGLVERACTEIIDRCVGRRTVLVFCCGVDHAFHVRDVLRSRGETAETITGGTPQEEREQIIERFRSGEIRFVTNVQVLTTGSNIPPIDCIAMLRATMSTGLYVQIVGRGCRPSEATGKTDLLLLDFGGNIYRHGPIDNVNPKLDRSSLKECPDCAEVVQARAEKCPACGHEWETRKNGATERKPRSPNHNWMPDVAPVQLTHQEWLDVTSVEYAMHRKRDDPSAPPSLRVEYLCGFYPHKEWISFERTGFPRQRAEQWWVAMGGQYPIPATVAEALKRTSELDEIVAITARPDGTWWRVIDRKVTRPGGTVEEIDDASRIHAEGARQAKLEAMRSVPLKEEMRDEVPF